MLNGETTLIDSDVAEDVLKSNWNKSLDGYVHGYRNEIGKTVRLHRYLTKAPFGMHVDHINHDKLDNRMENLRVVTPLINNQNSAKSIYASSQYKGVRYVKDRYECWVGDRYFGSYSYEEWAAYAYDFHAVEIYGQEAIINGIPKPDNFLLYVKFQSQGLPKGLDKRKNGSYTAFVDSNGKRTILGTYKDINVAAEVAQKERDKRDKERNESYLIKSIIRNEDGVAIITTSLGVKILVDDDVWHTLSQSSWNIDHGYAVGRSSMHRNVRMHRSVMGITDPTILVDHINGDRCDNRKSNLRISTLSKNSQNRKKIDNCASNFKGVSIRRNGTLMSQICFEGKKMNLGYFRTENEAAYVYDRKAIELFGEGAKINGVDRPPLIRKIVRSGYETLNL